MNVLNIVQVDFIKIINLSHVQNVLNLVKNANLTLNVKVATKTLP